MTDLRSALESAKKALLSFGGWDLWTEHCLQCVGEEAEDLQTVTRPLSET